MNSLLRRLSQSMICLLWAAFIVTLSGCDAIRSMTEKPADPAPAPQVAPSAPPVAPAPAPVPVPVARTPEQVISEFLALSSPEKNDDNLKQVSELKEGLDAITVLDLSRSAVTDVGMKYLAALPKLGELDLTETRVTSGGLASVAEVKSLKSLTLARMRGVDDLGIQNLLPLKDLQSVTVSGCAVTDGILPMLAEFEGLQFLDLSGNPDVYGKDFKTLTAKGAFRNLRELNVIGSKFGFYGMEKMNDLPQLEVLRAARCELVGVALNGMNGCDELRVLDLSGNNMQDANMKGVNRLKKLEELRLGQLNLTDDFLNTAKTMKELKILDLRETRVTLPAIKLLKEKFLKDTEILAFDQKF